MNKERDTEKMEASQKNNMWVVTCSCAVPEPGGSFTVTANFFSCYCDLLDPKRSEAMVMTVPDSFLFRWEICEEVFTMGNQRQNSRGTENEHAFTDILDTVSIETLGKGICSKGKAKTRCYQSTLLMPREMK